MKIIFGILVIGSLLNILKLGVGAELSDDVMKDIKKDCRNNGGVWTETTEPTGDWELAKRLDEVLNYVENKCNDQGRELSRLEETGECVWYQEGLFCVTVYTARKKDSSGTTLSIVHQC